MIPSYSWRPRVFPALFSPLALYRFTTSSDMTDYSGNARTLLSTAGNLYTPGVSTKKSAVINLTNPPGTRTDAAFCLTGALSVWALFWVNTSTASCSIARCGNAIGGGGTRVNWSLDLIQSGGFPALQYFHQAAGDVVTVSGRITKGWSVLGFTRNSAGTVVKFYANGLNITTSGTLTAATLSASAMTAIGGIPVFIPAFGFGPIARPLDQIGIYGSELTAAQMKYIARYVLGASA